MVDSLKLIVALTLGGALMLALLVVAAHAETKTIVLDGCAKVETAMESGGVPPTLTVRCTGETGGPKVRAGASFLGDDYGPSLTMPHLGVPKSWKCNGESATQPC